MAGTVIVYCKLPNGLEIEVGDKKARLNGWSEYLMPSPSRGHQNKDVEQGGGITTVDKDLWDAWYSKHQWFAPVKNGLLYASGNRNETLAKAKDTDKAPMSPLDPIKPIPGIQATEETLKEISKTQASLAK